MSCENDEERELQTALFNLKRANLAMDGLIIKYQIKRLKLSFDLKKIHCGIPLALHNNI